MQTMSDAQCEPEKATKVSLEELARLTGFSTDLIRDELFTGARTSDGVCLEDLRAMMLKYIDATLIQE